MEVYTFMPLMVQPDLPVQILMPEHKPTKPGLTAGTQSSGPLLAAPTHTAVPRENPGWLTSALLEGFGFFTRPAGKQGSAVLRLSWQGHQTCTPQGSAVIGLRALTKSKCLTALLQEGPWASWGGDYSAWDLDFYFFFFLFLRTLRATCLSEGLFLRGIRILAHTYTGFS